MKKLSLIVALAVVLTIGGVFASWTYYEGGVDSTAAITVGVGVDEATTVKLGTLSTTGELGINFTNADSSYATKMVVTGSPVVVTFTPSALGNNGNYNGTISVKATISVESDIIGLEQAEVTLGTITGAGSVDLTEAELLAALSHTPETLSTKDLYNAFAAKVGTSTVSIVISATETVAHS